MGGFNLNLTFRVIIYTLVVELIPLFYTCTCCMSICDNIAIDSTYFINLHT